MSLYCKKYKRIINKQNELEKCLCRFIHNGNCGICPCLIDLETNKEVYKVLYNKKETGNNNGFWQTRNKKWIELLKTIKRIERKGGLV